jgi:hypothetical protein
MGRKEMRGSMKLGRPRRLQARKHIARRTVGGKGRERGLKGRVWRP